MPDAPGTTQTTTAPVPAASTQATAPPAAAPPQAPPAASPASTTTPTATTPTPAPTESPLEHGYRKPVAPAVDQKATATPPASATPPVPATGTPPVPATELKLPDQSLLAPTALDVIKTLATDMKLDTAGAQRVLDLANQQVSEFAKSRVDKWNADREQDVVRIKADPEVGGDKYETAKENASRFLERFDPDKALFNQLKALGAHSALNLFKTFARVGAAMREDGVVLPSGDGGGPPADPKKALQSQMYTQMNTKK